MSDFVLYMQDQDQLVGLVCCSVTAGFQVGAKCDLALCACLWRPNSILTLCFAEICVFTAAFILSVGAAAVAGGSITYLHVDDMGAVNILVWAYTTAAMMTEYKDGRLAADSGIRDRPVVAVWLMVHRLFLRQVNRMLEPHRTAAQKKLYPLRASVALDLPQLIRMLRQRDIPFLLFNQRVGDAVHIPTGNPHAGV